MTDMKSLQFSQIFDKKDDEGMKEIISRVATRVFLESKGEMDESLCNPAAIVSLIQYLRHLLHIVCMQNGVQLNQFDEALELSVPENKETKH